MSHDAPDPRLVRVLGGPELASVRLRLRRHFERAEPEAAPAIIRLDALDPAAHMALCQLTGRPSRKARSMMLDIGALDIQLREADLADSLRDALERLDGPIVAKARLRQALQDQWSALVATAGVGPLLRAWLDAAPDALVRLKRLGRGPEGAAQLLAAADAVLGRLPAQGQPRSQLAAETLGDAHALDDRRPVASLVLTAWRHGERRGRDGECVAIGPDGAEDAEERLREVWARAGILVNELARPALLLNLPVVDMALATWKPGEPAYLSLRQLLRMPPAWAVDGRSVFVCENANLLAIVADRLGAWCAPMVCTDGMPAAAQRTLLDQLWRAGARLHYHGDFDWPGIGIANFVMQTWQATPWRLSASDYEAAVCAAPGWRHDLGPGTIGAAWDPLLAPAMRRHGVAIAEEAVAAVLIEDLHGRGPASFISRASHP
ncbi:TIGR02679 family protein [Gluconacetobacter sp. Hr-1-5]|uniref:TIGR02679 family protein n=1 Tax=Gluconacetobacter sp. Hr-1-5 TaxID=3395370 RepID=UPI003B52659F